jgi:putative SOS response-associated peptidase YedK
MCNLYTLRNYPTSAIYDLFGIDPDDMYGLAFKANVYPKYAGLVIRARTDKPGREPAVLRWGMIPFFAKDMKLCPNNARADTLLEKAMFKQPFERKQRCLIPATGFCEFKDKQWHELTVKDQPMFALAGIWDRWTKGESPVESYTMITTEANQFVSDYHARMPVIIPPSDFDLWLAGDDKQAASLLGPFAGEIAAAPLA